LFFLREAAVTSSPIAAVIPPVLLASAGGRVRGRTVRHLPLAEPLPGTRLAREVVYGLGRVDASGRIAARAVTEALGWRGGDRLTLTADTGVVVARRDPGGMVILPVRPCVVVPAALRRRCGLRAGDRVLLAALPGEDALAAYPIALVDEAIRAYRPILPTRGGIQ
jgi:bifunctional DNA-binding transcriptional regulator/antitoxin component of YhaV-PrlF toxin-antitoxin module